MSRDEREAQVLADAELARRRQLWNARLCDASGAILVQAFAMPRAELEAALVAAMFANAHGMYRGEYLRVELEPYLTPEQAATLARGR